MRASKMKDYFRKTLAGATVALLSAPACNFDKFENELASKNFLAYELKISYCSEKRADCEAVLRESFRVDSDAYDRENRVSPMESSIIGKINEFQKSEGCVDSLHKKDYVRIEYNISDIKLEKDVKNNTENEKISTIGSRDFSSKADSFCREAAGKKSI